MMHTTPAVQISGLNKSFGNKLVLQNISLTFERGLTYGIVGPNGSGKTTLFRIINGALHCDSGSTRVFGQDPAAVDRRRIGYMPQTESL